MRLFVAARPPDPVLQAVADLPRPDVPGVRWTTCPQWHVTLRFLGSVDDAGEVVRALAALDAPPATAALGPAVEALSRSVLAVPVSGLDEVAAAVVDATAAVGEPPPDRGFTGHLTLARARRGAAVRRLAGAAIGGTWTVAEVCLVRSHLVPAGARYETLGSVLLGRR